MGCREDLQGSFESVGNESSRLVARNHETSVINSGWILSFCRVVGRWRVLLEKDKKRGKGVAAKGLAKAQNFPQGPTYNSAMPRVIPNPPGRTNLVWTTQYIHQTAPFQSGIPISTK